MVGYYFETFSGLAQGKGESEHEVDKMVDCELLNLLL